MNDAINSWFSPKFVYSTCNWIKSPSFTSDIKQKISGVFRTAVVYWSIYNLVDSGLANVFALETLTHGTGPLGYIGINLNGADPNWGGGSTGSSAGHGLGRYIENSKNYFHVFKDSEFSICKDYCNLGEKIATPIVKALLPKIHSIFSGMATFGYSLTDEYHNLPQGVMGGIAGFFTPTLKFRFTPKDLGIFENDPDYGKAAYRTTVAISNSRLGITGSLQQGINSDLFNRMTANPSKVLIGISLLVAAAAVAKMTYSYLHSPQKVEKSSTNSKSFWENAKSTLTDPFLLIVLNTL